MIEGEGKGLCSVQDIFRFPPQLCIVICHLSTTLPLDGGATLLVTGKLKESSRKHMAQFLSQVSQEAVEGESEEAVQEREARRELVERARLRLECVVGKESEDTGVKDLLGIFVESLEQTEATD